MKGIATATTKHERVGKVHRMRSGNAPTAERNRIRLTWAKCGQKVYWGWPFEIEPSNACLKCFPNLDPITAEAERLEEELALEGQPEPGQVADFGRPVNRTKVAKLQIGKAIPLDVGEDEEVLRFYVPVNVTNNMGRVTIELIDVDSYNREYKGDYS